MANLTFRNLYLTIEAFKQKKNIWFFYLLAFRGLSKTCNFSGYWHHNFNHNFEFVLNNKSQFLMQRSS